MCFVSLPPFGPVHLISYPPSCSHGGVLLWFTWITPLCKAEICEYVSVSERYLWRECEHVIYVMTGSTPRLRCEILKAEMLCRRPYCQVLSLAVTFDLPTRRFVHFLNAVMMTTHFYTFNIFRNFAIFLGGSIYSGAEWSITEVSRPKLHRAEFRVEIMMSKFPLKLHLWGVSVCGG